MSRNFTRITASWVSGSPTSSALPVPWGHFAGALVHISGTWAAAKMGLQQYVFGQWQPVLDWQGGYTGVSIASATGNASLECPPAWFYAGGEDLQIMLWSHNGTGTDVNQAAAFSIVLDLKD